MKRMQRYRQMGRGMLDKAKKAASSARKRLKEAKGNSKTMSLVLVGLVAVFGWFANKYKWLDDLKKPKKDDTNTTSK